MFDTCFSINCNCRNGPQRATTDMIKNSDHLNECLIQCIMTELFATNDKISIALIILNIVIG